MLILNILTKVQNINSNNPDSTLIPDNVPDPTLIDIRSILLVVTDTKLLVLKIDLVYLDKNIEAKIQFINSLMACLKKISIVKKL